jgi:hypothetical protein
MQNTKTEVFHQSQLVDALGKVNQTEQTRVSLAGEPDTAECQSPLQGNCRSEEELDLTRLPVLTRFSDFLASDENSEFLYQGPFPYQGSARFSPDGLVNRILRSLSLRSLLLRDTLSS